MYSFPFKKQYLISTAIASVIAIVVWFFVPKEYAAQVKLSDEYKETDLAVGLTKMAARMRSAGSQNEGINDIETYSKILATEDFLKAIEETKIPGKDITYGSWAIKQKRFWQTTDTFELVKEKLSFNVSRKQQTLYIQFKDADPVVASKMLDIVVKNLQATITDARRKSAENYYHYLQKERTRAEKEYREAQHAYAIFSDSHLFLQSEKEKMEFQKLEKDISTKYKAYKSISDNCSRQYALMQRTYFSFAVVKPNTVPVESNSNPIIYLATFVFFGLLFAKGWLLYKERKKSGEMRLSIGGIFAPWTITVEVWIGVFLLYYLSSPTLNRPSEQFYISLLLWIPIFVLTSFITFNLLEHNSKPMTVDTFCLNKNVFNLILIISILLSPVLLFNVFKIISMFYTEDTLANIRTLAVHGEGNGIFSLASVFSQVSFIVGICAYPKTKKWMIIASTVCCFLCSIAIMEKGILITMFLCSSYILYERKVISFRGLTLSCLIVVGLMFLFNIFRAGTDSDYSKQTTMLDFISMYILSPIPAYCTVSHDVSQQFGVNTFAVIYDYLNRFGFGPFEIHEKLQEFVFVPIPTNVYTIFQPFYRDFGYWGIAVFAAIYGIIMGMTYRYSKNGNSFFICLYTYFFSLIVLQFYQENLFLTLSFNVQFIVLLLLCTQNFIKLSI